MYGVGSLKQLLQVSRMVGFNGRDDIISHLRGVLQSKTALPEQQFI
jgi:hypothetical protein